MFAGICQEHIALQPETRAEEQLLYRLFSNVEPPRCWFTFDLDNYRGLDEELAREISQTDPFGPGTRALVITTPTLQEQSDDSPDFEGFA